MINKKSWKWGDPQQPQHGATKKWVFIKQRNPPEHVLKLTQDHYSIC